VPRVGDPLERALAAVVERDARAADEILHRARDEDLAGVGEPGQPRTDVHRDAHQLATALFALARVES
jgi:hypothetical protein